VIRTMTSIELIEQTLALARQRRLPRQQQPACASLTLRPGAGSYQGQALWNRADLSFGYLTANGGYRGHQFPVVIGETGNMLTQARPPSRAARRRTPSRKQQQQLACTAGAPPQLGRRYAAPPVPSCSPGSRPALGRTPGAQPVHA
jgi:hypothetical protein